MPENPKKLFQFVIDRTKENADSVLVRYRQKREEKQKTCAEIYGYVCGLRSYYVDIPEKRIGLMGINSWEWMCHGWALLNAEKTTAFLDPLLALEDLICAVDRSDLDMIVVEPDLVEVAEAVQKQLPNLKVEVYKQTEDVRESYSEAEKWREGDAIFYTSGTTKNSKIVVTPTSSICGHAIANLETTECLPEKTMMLALPMHHSFGFAMMHFYILRGACIYISSMKSLLLDVKRVQPEMMLLVPSAAEFLLKKKAFTDKMYSIVISGSYCPEDLGDRLKAQGILVQNQYGSSELPCGIAVSLPQDCVNSLTVLSTACIEVSLEQEIIVKDENHFKEYYKQPEDTEKVLKDGRIYTGDIGYLDSDGKLHLAGRKNNMILMENGEKLFYTDVEKELTLLPDITDAAVIYQNKKLIAVLAVKTGMTQDEAEKIVSVYNTEQPYYRKIREVWIYGTALPYTSSGKLKRSAIEEEYRKMVGSDFLK